jgi:uncharacterized membrane protein
MDFTQLWILIPFIGIGWLAAVAAKRSSFKRSGDPYAAHRVYWSVWSLVSLFGIFIFLYRAF